MEQHNFYTISSHLLKLMARTQMTPFALIYAGNSTVKGLVIKNFAGGGVHLTGAGNNIIESNFIGTDVTGTVPAGNGELGVLIEDSDDNLIGGNTLIARNIISGNICGLQIYGESEFNTVSGNYIGTDVTGTFALGNLWVGIFITGDTKNNIIGGTETGAGNIIAFNIGAGILISYADGTTQNRILRNSVFSNNEIGIDLSIESVFPYWDGVTPNDPGDPDTGPNNLQNFPEIATISIDGVGDLWIDYFVDSDPANSTYPISVQFFKADDEGEGQTYFGSDIFTEDDYNAGNKSVNLGNADELGVSNGDVLVTTATDDNGNTSEFSLAITTGIVEPGTYSKANCLLHNYPNPFKSSTKIEFTLTHSGFVTLTIYNAFGKAIQTLVNKSMYPGIYTVVFNADDNTNGIYFYKLQMGNSLTKTKKMTLIH